MPISALKVRLDALRKAQNSDGGWGYFPGKESWLEPTAYAALALHGEPEADRAWKLLTSWQLPDGSWKPSERVKVSNWGTSLCVTLALARNENGEALNKGVQWLVGSAGVETNAIGIWLQRLHIAKPDRDISLKAWPWLPGDSSWLEPTVHAVVALKQAAPKFSGAEKSLRADLIERVRIGETQILSVRGSDGGWNYGNPKALNIDLPSYPETTALALVGLQERSDLDSAFRAAEAMLGKTPSPLARAWLSIAQRLHGAQAPELTAEPARDVMITAVEALSAAEGNWTLLKVGNRG